MAGVVKKAKIFSGGVAGVLLILTLSSLVYALNENDDFDFVVNDELELVNLEVNGEKIDFLVMTREETPVMLRILSQDGVVFEDEDIIVGYKKFSVNLQPGEYELVIKSQRGVVTSSFRIEQANEALTRLIATSQSSFVANSYSNTTPYVVWHGFLDRSRKFAPEQTLRYGALLYINDSGAVVPFANKGITVNITHYSYEEPYGEIEVYRKDVSTDANGLLIFNWNISDNATFADYDYRLKTYYNGEKLKTNYFGVMPFDTIGIQEIIALEGEMVSLPIMVVIPGTKQPYNGDATLRVFGTLKNGSNYYIKNENISIVDGVKNINLSIPNLEFESDPSIRLLPVGTDDDWNSEYITRLKVMAKNDSVVGLVPDYLWLTQDTLATFSVVLTDIGGIPRTGGRSVTVKASYWNGSEDILLFNSTLSTDSYGTATFSFITPDLDDQTHVEIRAEEEESGQYDRAWVWIGPSEKDMTLKCELDHSNYWGETATGTIELINESKPISNTVVNVLVPVFNITKTLTTDSQGKATFQFDVPASFISRSKIIATSVVEDRILSCDDSFSARYITSSSASG